MKRRAFSLYFSKALATLLTAGCAFSLGSCDVLHEDLEPCPQGMRLRFVYNYNMEFANAFPSQVDCLTVMVYDEQGNWLQTRNAVADQTSNENWRMEFPMPAGTYHVLAYGGMSCDDASFSFSANPSSIPEQDLKVLLKPDLIGKQLHPLFYGAATVNVAAAGTDTDYTEATVSMMKDTNDIRVLLANENGTPVNADDFNFTITDNNTEYDYQNEIISTQNVTYTPWIKGNANVGLTDDDTPAQVAWSEFSIARLVPSSRADLTVTRVSDGKRVLSIPLVNILALYKSQRYSTMPTREFLDRESRWNMTFFLTADGVWAGVSIVINDWVVRINNISDL